MSYRNLLLPVGLLSGTIIGAGVFALPYLFSQAGLALGFFYLTLGTLTYIIVHLMYADLVMRTAGEHRFIGLGERYLGGWAKPAGMMMAILQMIFVMTIYLILSLSFINLLLPAGFGFVKLVAFWALGSAAIFFNTKRLALAELLVSWGIIAIIGLLFLIGIERFETNASQIGLINSSVFFLPLGPIFFSLAGRVAIPSVVEYFRLPGVGHKHVLIRRTVVLGTIVPAIVYSAFIIGVIGISNQVSEDAVSGLISLLPEWVLIAVGFLGILSLWSSYIVVGIDVKDTLAYDLKIGPIPRAIVVVAVPIGLYLAGFQNFIELVGFVGGIFLALEGIFIVIMWIRANRAHKRTSVLMPRLGFVAAYATMVPFVTAFAYEIYRYAH